MESLKDLNKRVSFDVPKELYRQMKELSNFENTSIKLVFIQAVIWYVDQNMFKTNLHPEKEEAIVNMLENKINSKDVAKITNVDQNLIQKIEEKLNRRRTNSKLFQKTKSSFYKANFSIPKNLYKQIKEIVLRENIFIKDFAISACSDYIKEKTKGITIHPEKYSIIENMIKEDFSVEKISSAVNIPSSVIMKIKKETAEGGGGK